MDSYYVYTVSMGEEIIYVGKGKDDRFKHALSGKSHNLKLNKFYFEHLLLSKPLPVVEIVEYFPTEIKALRHEKFLISEYLPECNIRGKVNHSAEHLLKVFKDDYTDDTFIAPVPDDYDNFKIYFNGCYEDYLSNSVAENPHPLKWYVYGKLISDGWIHYHDMLSDYYKELTDDYEDKRKNNKGRPRKSFRDLLDMTDTQRYAFYKWQRKVVGYKLSIKDPEHIKMVKDWLESKKW